jgi:hypothetical protein
VTSQRSRECHRGRTGGYIGLGHSGHDDRRGLVQPDRHVTVGWGRDYYTDVVPVRGVLFGPPAGQTLTISVDVAPLAPGDG